MGRYLLQGEKAKTYIFFSDCFMIFLNEIYSFLRVSLQSYLYYLTKEGELKEEIMEIMRWMLVEILPEMNETIGSLNRNKYFKFKKRGIKIELFNSY